MSSDEASRLKAFASRHGGSIDNLSLDERDELNRKLKKRDTMNARGMTDRAETLKREVAAGLDIASADDEPETLSADAAADILRKHGLETLNFRWQSEEKVEWLEKKKQVFGLVETLNH